MTEEKTSRICGIDGVGGTAIFMRYKSIHAPLSLPYLRYGVCLIALLLLARMVTGNDLFYLEKRILDQAETLYGDAAGKRLLAWQRLIREDDSTADKQKLEKVNTFFNKLQFVSDQAHWNREDYWATPIEFIASDGGDCEDFALAKFFTLKLLGVEENKLNLTYVKSWKTKQAHMVLTYYRAPASEPLVLDNLIDEIEPASRRKDLLPVYSFNGDGLWIAKERGRGNKVGGTDRLSLWNDLLGRLPQNMKP